MGNIFTGVFRSSTPIDPNDTLNYLTRGIFSNIDMIDLFSMMDERKCSEYIIFGENVIDKYFQRMRLSPTRDNLGRIYFKKMTTLSKELLKSEDHRRMCKEISHFFADILRCFGAIYISILWSSVELNKIAGEFPADGYAAAQAFPKETTVFERVFRQKGGAETKLSSIKEIVDNSREVGGILCIFLKGNSEKSFTTNTDNTESIYIESDGNRISVMTGSINGYYPEDKGSPTENRGSPTFGFGPVTPGLGALKNTTVTFKDFLDLRKTSPTNDRKFVFIYNNEPIRMTYKFYTGTEESSAYKYSFELTLETRDNEGTLIGSFHLKNFKWEQPPPNIIDNIEEKEISFNTVMNGQNSLLVISDSGKQRNERVYPHMFRVCKKLADESWINPRINTYTYLLRWDYVSESTGSGLRQMKNIGSPDLYFDESTRNSPLVRIVYVKNNVKIPGRREPDRINVSCFLSINRKDSDSTEGKVYSVTIERMAASSQSDINIEGIFTPLSEPLHTTFKAMTDREQPRMTRTGSDIPKFIRLAAEKQFRIHATEGDVTSYRKAPGAVGYLKIPTINQRDPYDLSVLQGMMRPERTPFPACRALAAELLQNLGNNRYSTAACSATFRTSIKGSLPTSDELRSSKGILALSSLFLETTKDAAGKLTLNKEWGEFEKRMKEQSSKKLKAQCKENASLSVDSSLASQVQNVVRELEERHDRHISLGFDLLWELFDKDAALDRKGFVLNYRLLSRDREYLDSIKKRCIDLLTNYYIDCDRIFLSGLKLIIDRQGKPVANTAPARPKAQGDRNENDDEENNIEEYNGNDEGRGEPSAKIKEALKEQLERV